MDPFSFGSVQTGFKISQASYIFFLPEKSDPAFPDILYQRFDVRIGAVIIHHFNLHSRRTRILRQHTSNGVGEDICCNYTQGSSPTIADAQYGDQLVQSKGAIRVCVHS